MKHILIALFVLITVSVNAQFPGTDSLRNFNNKYITNNATAAFTNLRLHNLLAGMIDWIDTARAGTGGGGALGIDTIYAVNDSLVRYRRNGVFHQFVVRGTQFSGGNIYEIPFGDGLGGLQRDSNILFDKSQGADAGRLIVGPAGLTTGGLSKINATSDNMNALALTSYGTGLNSIITRRANGTVAAPTALTSGQDLWNISGRGYTGSDFTTSGKAAIYGQTTQNWTTTANGTKLFFRTTSNDTSLAIDRMIVGDSIQVSPVLAATSDSIAGLRLDAATGLHTILKIPLPAQVDTSNLSNRIDLKLNISDTTGKWVYDIFKRNDSIYMTKNGVEIFRFIDIGATGDFAPLFKVDTSSEFATVFVIGGESNPIGVLPNTNLSGAELAAFPRIQILNNDNFLLEPLQIGVNNNINVNSSLSFHGMELQLMKSMVAGTGILDDTVYMVKIGRSAAQIETLIDSLPTAYARLDTALKQIRALGKIPQIYMVHIQGTNGFATDSATWVKNTLYYTTQIRKHINNYFPIFEATLVGNGATRNNAINALPYWDGFTHVINTTGFTTMDSNHWDSSGIANICKKVIDLIVDTVKQRDLLAHSKVDNLKEGYIEATMIKVDNDVYVNGMRISASLGNHFVGYTSGLSLTTGNLNTAVGYTSLKSVTSGSNNTALGYRTMFNLTTASNNMAIGESALEDNLSADNNVAIGGIAGQHTITSNNTIIGYSAGRTFTTGALNTIIGSTALLSATNANVSVAIGYGAMGSQTNSSRNIAIGVNASLNGSTGANNITIGTEANRDNNGSNNTVIGDQALFGPTGVTGAVAIGYNVAQSGISSNQLWIDNSSTTSPLIRGYFTPDSLVVNGFLKSRDSLAIGKTRTGTSADSVLVIDATNRSVKTVAQSSIANGITSINSQTGPAITISGDATNGISASAASNTVTVTNTTDLESFGTDANNTGTGETDLYSHTLAANKLTLSGKGVRFRITGTNNDATATEQIKGYFAGTNIFDSGALTISSAGDWIIDMEVQRTSSTTAAATVTFMAANTTVTLPVKYTPLTGLDWTTTNIFKITGTAAGAGGGSSDITAHAGKVVFVP